MFDELLSARGSHPLNPRIQKSVELCKLRLLLGNTGCSSFSCDFVCALVNLRVLGHEFLCRLPRAALSLDDSFG